MNSRAIPSSRSSRVSSVSSAMVRPASVAAVTPGFSARRTVTSPGASSKFSPSRTIVTVSPASSLRRESAESFAISAAAAFILGPSFAPRTLKFAFAESVTSSASESRIRISLTSSSSATMSFVPSRSSRTLGSAATRIALASG